MRVISGCVRGLKLVSPEGESTRPTLDRVKEAVFNITAPYLCDSVILDLFAGSGALGIEALSRGAKKVYFIDNSSDAIKCVKQNISNGKFLDSSVVIKADAASFLSECKEKFDIIFIDPPYSKNMYFSTLSLIQKNDCLSDNGLIIIEWDSRVGFNNEIDYFEVFKEKKYV